MQKKDSRVNRLDSTLRQNYTEFRCHFYLTSLYHRPDSVQFTVYHAVVAKLQSAGYVPQFVQLCESRDELYDVAVGLQTDNQAIKFLNRESTLIFPNKSGQKCAANIKISKSFFLYVTEILKLKFKHEVYESNYKPKSRSRSKKVYGTLLLLGIPLQSTAKQTLNELCHQIRFTPSYLQQPCFKCEDEVQFLQLRIPSQQIQAILNTQIRINGQNIIVIKKQATPLLEALRKLQIRLKLDRSLIDELQLWKLIEQKSFIAFLFAENQSRNYFLLVRTKPCQKDFNLRSEAVVPLKLDVGLPVPRPKKKDILSNVIKEAFQELW